MASLPSAPGCRAENAVGKYISAHGPKVERHVGTIRMCISLATTCGFCRASRNAGRLGPDPCGVTGAPETALKRYGQGPTCRFAKARPEPDFR